MTSAQFQKLVLALVTAGLTAGSLAVIAADKPEDKNGKQPVEKCYGVAKKGKNDCKSDAHSCAGLSTKDKDKADYILVPEGTCQKIIGGTTK